MHISTDPRYHDPHIHDRLSAVPLQTSSSQDNLLRFVMYQLPPILLVAVSVTLDWFQFSQHRLLLVVDFECDCTTTIALFDQFRRFHHGAASRPRLLLRRLHFFTIGTEKCFLWVWIYTTALL